MGSEIASSLRFLRFLSDPGHMCLVLQSYVSPRILLDLQLRLVLEWYAVSFI